MTQTVEVGENRPRPMTIEDDIAFLDEVPAFVSLGLEALRILAIGSETMYVHTGERLYEAGEPADCGYVVHEGQFRLSAGGDDDPGAVTVGRGTLLGELALITETNRQSTATALEPSSVIRISRNLFMKTLEGYPDAALRMRDELARRTEESADEILRVRELLARGEADKQ